MVNPVNSWSLMPTMLILQDVSWRTCMSDLARPPLAPLLMSCVAALLTLVNTYCLWTSEVWGPCGLTEKIQRH